MIAFVIWISACDGVGSPEGWLCTNILEGRISFRSKLLVISYVRKGYAVGVSSSLPIVIDPKCHAVACYETPRSRCGTDSESTSISARPFHSALTARSGTVTPPLGPEGVIVKVGCSRSLRETGPPGDAVELANGASLSSRMPAGAYEFAPYDVQTFGEAIPFRPLARLI
jgi:hypothetical protein